MCHMTKGFFGPSGLPAPAAPPWWSSGCWSSPPRHWSRSSGSPSTSPTSTRRAVAPVLPQGGAPCGNNSTRFRLCDCPDICPAGGARSFYNLTHLPRLPGTLVPVDLQFLVRPARDASWGAETPCPSPGGRQNAHGQPETTHHASAGHPDSLHDLQTGRTGEKRHNKGLRRRSI